jgi:hypothetical protein
MKGRFLSVSSLRGYYAVLFLILFIVTGTIAFLTLWPRYQANIEKNQILIARINALSRSADSSSVKISAIHRDTKLAKKSIFRTMIDASRSGLRRSIQAPSVGQTNPHPAPVPTFIDFKPRYYVFFGEYENYHEAMGRYAELYEKHNITTELVRLGVDQAARHIVVLAPKSTSEGYTELEVGTLAQQYKNLGAKAICLFQPDRYR